MNKYKDLMIWQKSLTLATTIYELTSRFPSDEKYGLIAQMRRCAISIPSNIAEGGGRNSDREFSRFLSIGYGSLCELETQLLIALNLNIIDSEVSERISKDIEELQKMIYSLIRKLSIE